MTVVLRVDAVPSAAALLLRPWHEADIEPLVEATRDPVLRRWMTHPVGNVEEAVRWLDTQKDGWASGKRLSFAVLEDGPGAGESRLVGNMVLKKPDAAPGSAEVGYWTAAHAQGRGVATRALEALTRWAFEIFATDGLNRLDLIHQVDNHASCRVAEKAGYGFDQILPAGPPFPKEGHLHVRHAGRDPSAGPDKSGAWTRD